MAASTQTCAMCSGTGWKMVEVPGPNGRPDRRATRCDCKLADLQNKLLAQARIPSRYEHCEFADYDTKWPGADPSIGRARLECQRFVEEFPTESTGLLLLGDIGVGKTHLAVSIVRELIMKKSVRCLFWDYRELLKEIQNTYNPSVQATELQVLQPVFDADVLVLDELGAVRPTEWVQDAVNFILNTRYNDKKTTILTTNYDDLAPSAALGDKETVDRFKGPRRREETLGDRIGERMRSRIHEMCRIIEMRGPDFRQKFKSGSYR